MIANTTKIRPSYLVALEAGAVDQLPPRFFTRGFVRAYAKEVGLDPDQSADRYLAEIALVAPAEGEEMAAVVETAVGRTGVIGFEQHHAPLINSHNDGSSRLMLAAAVIGAIVYVGPINWQRWTAKPGSATMTQSALVLRVGDPGTCAFSINGRAGRPLAPAGTAVTVRITKDNFKEYVSS